MIDCWQRSLISSPCRATIIFRTLNDGNLQLLFSIKLSCECKKVVSDILGAIKFVVGIESTCKMIHLSHGTSLNSKYLQWTKQDVKKR